MDLLQTVPVYCAWCGEPIELLVDCSVPDQEYVEDCAVCCRPLVVSARVDEEGVARVEVRFEDE